MRKPLITLLTVAIACMIPYFMPSMDRFRLLRPAALPAPVQEPHKSPLAIVPKAQQRAAKVNDEAGSIDIGEPDPVSVEGASALSYFFSALAHTRTGEANAVTRIVHIGDSPLAGDLISSEARMLLQKEFGDGGPGWHLPARPWEFYSHDRMTLKAEGWRILSALLQSPGNKSDYGLAGIAFSSASPAAYSTISGWRKNPPSFSRVEVHYQAKPGGGSFTVAVDGKFLQEVSTATDDRAIKMTSLAVPDGPHEVTVRPKGNGDVTLFGIALERDGPGVVYDSLGALGLSIHWMTIPNRDEWIESLRLRHPHLVILALGTNESSPDFYPGTQYESDYRNIIEAIRAAVPGVSILIMAPMDRGMRDPSGEIVTNPAIPRLVEAQRRIARDNNVAFYNTYEGMGGDGTMSRWYRGKPRLVSGDFTHPTLAGANRVGAWMVRALLEAASIPNSSPIQMQP